MFGFKKNAKVQTKEQMTHALSQWQQMKDKGQLHFVIRHGLINWALMTSGIYFVLIFVSNKFQMTWALFQEMIPTFGLFALGGILFGLVMWRLSEKKFAAIAAQMPTKKGSKRSKQ